MADELADLRDRVQRLEQALKEILAQLERIERYTVPRAENPSDQATVRQKVTYDWQA